MTSAIIATSVYDLCPTSSRKSFYGKAKVIVAEGITFLMSYNTIVCGRDADGIIHRYSDWDSMTTRCHTKSFLGNKYDGFWELAIENTPTITLTLSK